MKILHTSDWHLGQEFYSYDRTEEHIAFLTQIRDIVAEEKPDVMVVSGDIYHTSTPSNSVMRLFNEYVYQIHSAYPSMRIIITAGNHDSSSRLEVTRNLWEHLGVDIIGRVDKIDGKVDYGKLIIPVRKRDEVCGYVVALPHVSPNAFPLDDGEVVKPEERMHCFMIHLGEYLETVNVEHLPVVMMAHMAISGSDAAGHDVSRVSMDYINIAELNAVDFDYLALGHIHCPQYIKETEKKARYCGTPIPVSFDEKYDHSVSVVELEEHGMQPQVCTVHIENPWPILTLPEDPVPFQEALERLSALDPHRKVYVRLHVLLEDVAPVNALEKVEAAVKGKDCRFCHIKWERRINEEKADHLTSLRVEEFVERSPLDIAKMYYRQKTGLDMNEELIELFNEAADAVRTAEEE